MIIPVQELIEAEAVRQRAAEVILGLAPRSEEPSWLERLFDRLNFGRLFGSWADANSGVLGILLLTLAAIVVLGLVVLVARQIDWRRGRHAALEGADPHAKVRETMEQLLARAREARSSGQRLSALRLLFAAFVVGLTRRGDLEFRDAWTNLELARRGAHTEELRRSLMPLVVELDGLVYGGREITDSHLNRLEQLVEGTRP